MKKRLQALISVLAIAMLITPNVLYAQSSGGSTSGNGFRVSPVREELTIQPGKSQTVDVYVQNVTKSPIVAHPVVNDFVANSDESGEPQLLLDNNAPAQGNSFRSLVGTLPDVPLKPQEQKTLKVPISVPANAPGGGYYGAVRFLPASLNNNEQISLTASVGVLFLVTVPGNITQNLDLVSLAASEHGNSGHFFTSTPDTIVTRLQNNGTIHVKPFGKVTVKDWRGKTIFTGEFNNSDPRGNVLPNSIRRFETSLGNAKPSFGRYTIEVALGYGNSGQLITGKSVFWVLPAWFMLSILVLILALIASIFVWKKRRAPRLHRR